MRLRALVAGCCALAVVTLGARAQDDSLGVDLPGSDSAYLPSPDALSPGRAFLYSAAVPGAGQLYVGASRGYAYLAGEAIMGVAYIISRNDARDIEQQYIDAVRAGVAFDGDGSFDATPPRATSQTPQTGSCPSSCEPTATAPSSAPAGSWARSSSTTW